MYRTVQDRREKTNREQRWPYNPKYWCGETGYSDFKRQCRRAARRKAQFDLRAGREPAPRYPVERVYFD